MKNITAEQLKTMTKEELSLKVVELQDDLNRTKKYGLVWDREKNPEEVVTKCYKEIPVLKMIDSLTIKENSTNLLDSTDNILIRGDNFHALSSLRLVAPVDGIVDVVYIDPPYNTGNKDFVYNDDYIDDEDRYKHSKWLNFIEKRMSVAYDLLKEDGLVFISIDDNEVADLVLLCNQIFGDQNLITVAPRVIKKGGKSTDTVAKNHDYLLIYCKNKALINFGRVDIVEDASKLEKDEYFDERGPYRLNQCLDYDSLQYNESMDYPIEIDGDVFYAGGSKELWEARHNGDHKKIDWVWRWSKPLLEWGLKNGYVVIKNGRRKRIYTKTYANSKIIKTDNGYATERTENTKSYDSLFFTNNIFSNDNAKKELDSFRLISKFDYPKPTSLIKECLKMRNKKDSVVLDFFAGSGTTGQAVLDLNAEDGGTRKFIVCTNNENSIFDKITYPRIKTVITGKRVDGTSYGDPRNGNLYCFDTSFVESSASDDQSKFDLVREIDGLLIIKESTFTKVLEKPFLSIYTNEKKDKHVFIFPSIPDKKKADIMVELSKQYDGQIIIYMFSLSNEIDEFKPLFTSSFLEKVDLKPIPSKIFEIYKNWVKNLKVEY